MADYYVWDCSAGTLKWYFDRDEAVVIIEGEVEVSGDGMSATWLRVGDGALFRAATIRRGLPAPLRVLIECARRAKQLVERALGRRSPAAGDELSAHQL